MLDSEIIVQEFMPYLRPQGKLWIAFSGGLDSSVLLAIVAKAGLPNQIRAIHINHQLSLHADAWQHHCEKTCASHGVPITIEKVTVVNRGQGIESAAREQRYQVFSGYLAKDDVILFAHHRDDQAETLLFRLLRGAGLAGLAGMRNHRCFHSAHIVRPLLRFSRREICQYADHHHLDWIEDESNDSLGFDRNYLRHEVFPLLETRWVDASRKMSSACAWLSEADGLLTEYVHEDLLRCELRSERVGESLEIKKLLQYSQVRQKHIIRGWCRKNYGLCPETAQLVLLDQVVSARVDAAPLLVWANYEFRRFRGRLYLMRKLPSFDVEEIEWSDDLPLQLPGGGRVECCDDGMGQTLTVRFRQGGERCKPRDRVKSQSLKKLLQEYALEPWLRDRVPLVYSGDTLLAVGDLFICQSCVTDSHPNISFLWVATSE